MAEIGVYYFTGWDQMRSDNLPPKRPATLDSIRPRGGPALPETQRTVDTSQLDGYGFLKPEFAEKGP
jgi:hypothetical protein